MPKEKLDRYLAETRAYLASPRGRISFRNAREVYGYSYQRALACAVMTATHLIVYERINEVVKAYMAKELVAA